MPDAVQSMLRSMSNVELAVVSAALTVILLTVYALVSRFRRERCELSRPLGHMHFDCYVINMPNEKKRMHGFSSMFQRCDLAKTHSLIRHKATVGKHIPVAQYTTSKALCEILRAERNTYRQKHYELTRGAIGCWLSHRNLWRNVLSTDKDCALIFEDDCMMARNLHGILKESRVPTDWDICLLGYMCNECEPMACADAIRVTRFFGLHCYMITRRGIEKILASPKMQLITKQIDSVLCDMIRDGEISVVALPEPVAWQNNADYDTSIQMQLRKVRGIDEWE
jgi:GR25 family glycosyltransferase involved in LPS biosynthesis